MIELLMMLEHGFDHICYDMSVTQASLSFDCVNYIHTPLYFPISLSKLMQHFEVRPDPSGCKVEAVTRTLHCPAQPMNLQFIDRKV